MMWHTILSLKKSSQVKKILYAGVLALFLFGGGIYSCGGGGNGGGSTPWGGGGVGGAGAPPVSIPGPEALNMQNVTISPPDNTGTVTVTGTPGAALPGAEVRVRNLGPQVAWYEKAVLSSAFAAVGDEVRVTANGAGAFTAQIKAVIGDRVSVSQRLSPATQYSAEFFGTVSNVPVQPTNPVPNSLIKPFMKSKMTVDPAGSGWIIQGSSSSKKWNWLDLFVSTAHAAEDLSIQNVSEVTCPQMGPCSLKASIAPHEGYCPLSKTDSNGKDLLSLQVPYCRALSDLKTGQIKGPPVINYLAVAAGKNTIILKEESPDKWVVSEVLRFPNLITQVQSDIQMSDLVFYLSTSQGFYQYNTRNRSVVFYSTKIGQLASNTSVVPTAFAKSGSYIIYSVWMNNQALIVQGDVVRDANFNFQRVVNFSIPNQIVEMLIVGTDEDKSVDLPSGRVIYKVNRYAFVAGKKVYLLELPTYAAYTDLSSHADLDMTRLEKLVSVDFPEATRDFTMMADNPNLSLLAVSDGEKVYYVDYNFGEAVPLQAFKNSRVTDLNQEGAGEVTALIYNPVSRSFIMRTRAEVTPADANNPVIQDRGRSVSISFDENVPVEIRGSRSLSGAREIQSPTVRLTGPRRMPAPASGSVTTSPLR